MGFEVGPTNTQQISDGSSSSSSYNDLSVGSNSSFPNQAHVNIHGEKRDQLIPMDYSDLTMNHTDWKAMLPPGENELVWKSASLSFSLDKRTGKNCFVVGPRGLVIQQDNREIISNSQSRFSEVAEIKYNSPQTYIGCRIGTQRLSPDTIYGAYLVFKLGTLSSPCGDETDDFFLNDLHEELHWLNLFLEYAYATISLFEFADVGEIQGYKGVLKNTITTRELNVVDRGNGWKEVQIGNLYVEGKSRGEVIAVFKKEVYMEARLRGRPIVEGIEFRPTYRRPHLFGSFRLKTIKEKEKENISVVLKVEADSDEEKRKAMEVVSAVAGVEYVYMNKKEMKLTVVGYFSTRQVLKELRKSWHTESSFE